MIALVYNSISASKTYDLPRHEFAHGIQAGDIPSYIMGFKPNDTVVGYLLTVTPVGKRGCFQK